MPQFGHDGDSVHFGMRGGRVVATGTLILAAAGLLGSTTGCGNTPAEAQPQTTQSQEAKPENVAAAKSICQSTAPADVDVVKTALSYLSPDLVKAMDTAGIKATGDQTKNAPAGVAAELVKQYTANLESKSKGISAAYGANVFIKIVNEHGEPKGELPAWLQAAVQQESGDAGKARFGVNKKFYGPGQFESLQAALGADYVTITKDPMASLVGRALNPDLSCANPA
jgi:hypothetical protein